MLFRDSWNNYANMHGVKIDEKTYYYDNTNEQGKA